MSVSRTPFSLDDVAARAKQAEAGNNRAYELGRRAHVALRKLQRELEQGGSGDVAVPSALSQSQLLTEALDELIGQIPQVGHAGGDDGAAGSEHSAAPALPHSRTPRLANLSGRVEEYVRYLLFQHFLETGGRLLPPSSLASKWMPSPTSEKDSGGDDKTTSAAAASSSSSSPPLHVTDEEYLLACMGLTHDLHRYGMRRATQLDRDGVKQATDLVAQLFEFLMNLDFRNGPLRRRYDGTKYALKALETLLYELAVVANVGKPTENDTTGQNGSEEGARRAAKRPRGSHSNEEQLNGKATSTPAAWPLLPAEELQALQDRMVRRDELREALIKQCRDGQKAAKQAIFALHRGDSKRALQLLEECRSCIANRLIPVAVEEPTLRHSGSLSGVMEEYAEAKLFAVWLYGPESSDPAGGALPSRPSGVLLKMQDFGDDVGLSLDEYVGGLCDLTGEIGRYAVLRGTARDVDGVKFCLETVTDIYYALETIERLPQGAGKKMDPLRKGIEKMERMLYELRLSDAAGRKVVSDAAAQADPAARTEDLGED
jgi:predicted translin family RNA/ssDNA-binding protein